MELIINNQTAFSIELKNSGSLIQTIASEQSITLGLDSNGSYTFDYVETWLTSGLFSLVKNGVNLIRVQPLDLVEEKIPTCINYVSGDFTGYAELQKASDLFVFSGSESQSDSEFINLPLCVENSEPGSITINISNY
jgi:hypothetical protein